MTTYPALGIFLATVAIVGCSNDFAPYSRLDRLRLLGVQAEPATPLPGESVTLSALTYAPAGQPTTLHWTWCPAADSAASSYQCPLDPTQASQAFASALDAAVITLPSLDLGGESTAAFTNPFSLSALANLCVVGLDSSVYAQSFDCEGGFPVTIALDVATPAASLRAGFVLRLPVGDAPEINHNPVPAGLELAQTVLTDPPAAVTVSPGQTVDWHVDIPSAAIEPRSIPPSEGPPGQRLERLIASWFADSGKIDKDRTSFIDGETTMDETARNRWTAPTVDQWPASGVVAFAVVLRDDRGGVGWLLRQVILDMGP